MREILSRAFARMQRLHERRPLLVPALFFAIMQALVLAALMREEATRTLIFWYCNNISFFFAIAFWESRLQIVKALSYVGILPQLLWISDFIAHLVGFDLSNTANYVFVEGLTFANDVSILIHFGIPLVALLYTARIRPQPASLFYSALYVGGLYIATLAGTAQVDDINCVFNACTQFSFPYHAMFWPLYMSILVLGGFALHEGMYLATRRYDAWKYSRFGIPRQLAVSESQSL